MILNLEQYINDNINLKKDDIYYNEAFCNMTFDYVGICDGLTKKDIEFLNNNGYSKLDFMED